MSRDWRVTDRFADTPAAEAFADLDRVFALEGDVMATDPISRVIRVTAGDRRYFVKTYWEAGKNLRRYVGRTRIRGEWENLLFFEDVGVPTAPVVAYGQEYRGGKFHRGALITEELRGTDDLANLAEKEFPGLRDRRWVRRVADQVAEYARRLHDHGFVHTDLKWRNIMVTVEGEPKVYFIDCPSGRKVPGAMLGRGVIKDLACLDKVAKYQLPRGDRLYFYLRYTGIDRLRDEDRKRIRKILAFFEGRE